MYAVVTEKYTVLLGKYTVLHGKYTICGPPKGRILFFIRPFTFN